MHAPRSSNTYKCCCCSRKLAQPAQLQASSGWALAAAVVVVSGLPGKVKGFQLDQLGSMRPLRRQPPLQAAIGQQKPGKRCRQGLLLCLLSLSQLFCSNRGARW